LTPSCPSRGLPSAPTKLPSFIVSWIFVNCFRRLITSVAEN
jgi:hypothetical protein